MPQATDLTIANGQASPVNKTFTLIAPASGNGGIAEWALKEGTISAVFPTITFMAERQATNKTRKGRVKIRVPSSYVDSTTGLTNAGSAYEFNGNWTVPDDFPESAKADAAAYVFNGLATALFKTLLKDATPAT